MKRIGAWFFAIVLSLAVVVNVGAQTPETIWLTANTTAYKTGETVLVTVNAASATPIQGFTFQIRYDPECLTPVNASSLIPGMSGLQLPQLTGLVDGSYASTTPQMVNGVLAEVRFTALKGCQTNLSLESAALAVRTADGFAAPLASVLVGERNVSLNISTEIGAAQPQPETGSVLSLEPPVVEHSYAGWLIGILIVLVFGGIGIGAYKFLRVGG
jgi:hypothetical protein